MNRTPTTERMQTASWRRRTGAAFAVRAVAFGLPILLAAIAAMVVSARLPMTSSKPLLAIRTIGVVLPASAVYFVTDRLTRRLLPFATLLRMSLVFPEQAPSRRAIARLTFSRRRMAALVEDTRVNGVDPQLSSAATQVVMLATAISHHDRRSRGHAERVRAYADLLGEQLGLNPVQRQKLQWAALLHDVGKVAVPTELLDKRGSLTPDERTIVAGHAQVGSAMVEPLRPFLGSWIDAVGAHHERWDGRGYPRGLARTEIPPAAAIIAVCDAFDAMTTAQCHRRPMSLAAARAELERNSGTQFAPDVVRHFLELSLGRLRLAMGPIAALSHVPLLGSISQAPATVTAGMGAAASNAMSAATSVTTVAVMSTALVSAGAMAAPAPAPTAADTAYVLAVEARRAAAAPATIGQVVALPTITTLTSPRTAASAGAAPLGTLPAPQALDASGAPGAATAAAISGTSRSTTTAAPRNGNGNGNRGNDNRNDGNEDDNDSSRSNADDRSWNEDDSNDRNGNGNNGNGNGNGNDRSNMPVPTAAPTTTVAPPPTVEPYVVCVAETGRNRWRARFGYRNAGIDGRISAGASNAVSPGGTDQGQPERFKSGTDNRAFEVEMTNGSISWTVNGRTATATRDSARC